MSSQEKFQCSSADCKCNISNQNIKTRITPTFIHQDIFIQNQDNPSNHDCKFTSTFQSTVFQDGAWPCKRNIQHRPPDHQTQFFYPQAVAIIPQERRNKNKKSENVEKIRPSSAQKCHNEKKMLQKQQITTYKNDSAFKKQIFLNPHTHCCSNCMQLGFYKTRNTQSKSHWLDNCKEQRWRNIHNCNQHIISKQRKLIELSSQPLWGNDSEICINAFEHTGALNQAGCGCPHRQQLKKKEKQGCPFHRTQQSPQKKIIQQKVQLPQTKLTLKENPKPDQPPIENKQEGQEKNQGKIIMRHLNKRENNEKRNSTTGKKKVLEATSKINKKEKKSILYGNSTPLFTVINKRQR